MKTTYVSSCIDTGVSQLNIASLLLFVIFGFLFSILPLTLNAIMLVAVFTLLFKKITCLYRHYQSEYRTLSATEKDIISLYIEKHHHKLTLFTLSIKCFTVGILVYLLSDFLLYKFAIM